MERFIAEIVTIVISENCEKSLVEMTTISDVIIEIIHPSLSAFSSDWNQCASSDVPAIRSNQNVNI